MLLSMRVPQFVCRLISVFFDKPSAYQTFKLAEEVWRVNGDCSVSFEQRRYADEGGQMITNIKSDYANYPVSPSPDSFFCAIGPLSD